MRKKDRVRLFGYYLKNKLKIKTLCGRVCVCVGQGRSGFNLAEGQLYLLTYVNEYRGGSWAKTRTQAHTLNQFHVAAPEFLCGREKRDVAKSGEYLLPYYAPCIICGISESFWSWEVGLFPRPRLLLLLLLFV